MHWFVCNDNDKRHVAGQTIRGSAARAGRFFFYGDHPALPALKAWWHFFGRLNWFEIELKFGGDDSLVSLSMVLPWLAHIGFGVRVPRRWLSWWMLDDRVFALKLGYIGDPAWILIAFNEWGDDCGMLDYYRRQVPRKHTDLQLWRGYEIKLKWPPVLDWIFGREKRREEILATHDVKVPMDGRDHAAVVKVSHTYSVRPRWPWRFRHSYGSWIDVENPPRFAGKGENSYDCGDDAIWGMGSRETSPASIVGEYVKRVMEYRERYGMPSELAS